MIQWILSSAHSPVDPSFLPLRMRRWAGSSHGANHGTQTILCKSLTSTLLFLVLLSVPVRPVRPVRLLRQVTAMPHSTDATLTTSTTIDEKPNQPGQNAHLLLDNNQEPLPYWLVNVPRSQWPAECPDFLRNLPPKNISILSSSDDTYERQNWDMAKEFVSESCPAR